MREGDFGAREVFFLLCLGAVAVALSWAIVWLFTQTVILISSFATLISFSVWLMFQGV